MSKNWHNLSLIEIAETLNTDLDNGLSEKEAGIRREKFGENLLPEEKRLSGIAIFLEQFKSPLVYILLFAGIVTLILSEYTDSIVIFGAVFLNTIVGYIQERKASNALYQLKKFLKVKATIFRDGREKEIFLEKLVPGDIIVLKAGDKIPADGRIIENYDLKINESALTGEWMSASKTNKVLPQKTPLADRDNMVYMGTTVESGAGKAAVTETAKDSEIGRVAEMVKETEEEKTPYQQKIIKFSKKIGIIISIICLIIFLEGMLTGGEFKEMFTIAIAIAVAAIPEGLPVAMTVILALGMQRILKRKGLVRKLSSAETLGSTSIICTDKTLTLTEGKMEVSDTATFDNEIFTQTQKEWQVSFKEKADSLQVLLMTIAALCNEAFVENPRNLYSFWNVRGRPTDKALVLAAAEVGLFKPELEKKFPVIELLPFNSENKFIATLRGDATKGAKRVLYVSGAPEKILGLSSKIEIGGIKKVITKKTAEELNKKLESLTEQGLRVIAVANRNVPKDYESGSRNLKKICDDLTFVGFIGLKDPLRQDTKEAIKLCVKAGMKPIIVTGDHLLTAKAVANELGLKTGNKNVLEGKELNKLSDADFQKRLKNIELYARVEPRHKLRIIQAWKKRGEVVAMTGDGINDAPALKQADVGIALGSGTEVAKEVSDLVLLTDNFSIIPAAVEEGRAIIDNIRKVITYLLSDSFTEIILVAATILIFKLTGQPWILPITAVQILWVNLIEDGLPSIALAFEPKEKDLMRQKPQPRDIPLLTPEMKVIIFIIGILTDLILLILFFWLWDKTHYIGYVTTMIFAALSIDSLFYVFSCKSLRQNLWNINLFSNKFLLIAWFTGIIMLLVAVYVPFFQSFLKTVPIGIYDWIILAGLGITKLILIEAAKYYFIIKRQTER